MFGTCVNLSNYSGPITALFTAHLGARTVSQTPSCTPYTRQHEMNLHGDGHDAPDARERPDPCDDAHFVLEPPRTRRRLEVALDLLQPRGGALVELLAAPELLTPRVHVLVPARHQTRLSLVGSGFRFRKTQVGSEVVGEGQKRMPGSYSRAWCARHLIPYQTRLLLHVHLS